MSVYLIDTQSLIQLSVALNFAFATLNSLRTPVQTKMRRLAAVTHKRAEAQFAELSSFIYIQTLGFPKDLSESLRDRTTDCLKSRANADTLKIYSIAYEDGSENFSYWIGKYAVVIGILGLILLIISPIYQYYLLTMRVYIVIVALFMSPSVIIIIYNWTIANMMREEIAKIRKIQLEIGEIDTRLKEKYRPSLIIARKDGYLKEN